jgi:hypothetical protein
VDPGEAELVVILTTPFEDGGLNTDRGHTGVPLEWAPSLG